MASHIARTVRRASSFPSGPPAKPAMPHIALPLRPGAAHERLVPGAQALDDTSLVVLDAGVRLGRGAEAPGALGRPDDGAQGRREGLGIAGRDEDAGFPVTHRIGNAPDPGRDDRPRGCHPLEDGVGKGLGDRAQHGHVEQVMEVERRRESARELNASVQLQRPCQAGQLGALRSVTDTHEVRSRNRRRDARERFEESRVILVAIQASDDPDRQRVGGGAQAGAPGGSFPGRHWDESILREAVGGADGPTAWDPLPSRQQRGNAGTVCEHAVGGAAGPSIRDRMGPPGGRARVPPAAARHPERNPSETRPRYSEEVAVEVVRVEDIEARPGQEPGEADPLTYRARPVQVPQRHAHQLGRSLLEAGPQRAIRLKVDDGELKPLVTELLGPPDRVELCAADLEVVDTEGESNHRAHYPRVDTHAPATWATPATAQIRDDVAAGWSIARLPAESPPTLPERLHQPGRSASTCQFRARVGPGAYDPRQRRGISTTNRS